MPSKEVKQLVKKLKAQGFECIPTSNGHIRVFKDGNRVTTISSTPSKRSSIRHAITQAKRYGFQP